MGVDFEFFLFGVPPSIPSIKRRLSLLVPEYCAPQPSVLKLGGQPTSFLSDVCAISRQSVATSFSVTVRTDNSHEFGKQHCTVQIVWPKFHTRLHRLGGNATHVRTGLPFAAYLQDCASEAGAPN